MDDYGTPIVFMSGAKPRHSMLQALVYARANGYYIDSLEVGWTSDAWAVSSRHVTAENAKIYCVYVHH